MLTQVCFVLLCVDVVCSMAKRTSENIGSKGDILKSSVIDKRGGQSILLFFCSCKLASISVRSSPTNKYIYNVSDLKKLIKYILLLFELFISVDCLSYLC